MWAERHAYTMLKGLAVVALLLTVIGLYSVISFTVDSRMTEFGVRVAVGAGTGDLIRMVMRRGLVATGMGIFFGIAAAVGMTRFMQSLLFETEPFDPFVYLSVSLLLIMAAFCACWFPAMRAARVDVVKLLRTE
jgi:putative ABC transport system permease protein